MIQQQGKLSDEVMIEAIQKEYALPASMLTEILASNPQAAKSSEVTEALNERINPLSEYQNNQIKIGLYWQSEKEELAISVSMDQAMIEQAQFELLSALNGTENAVATALNAFDESSTTSELKMKADLMMRTGNVAGGMSMMQGLSGVIDMTVEESINHQYYLDMLAIQYDVLYNEPHTLTNEQLATLDDIYQSNYGGLGHFANVLLSIFAGYALDEEFEEDIPGDYRSERVAGENETSIAFASAWPNPANDFINIKLNTLSAESITYCITTLDGRVILKGELLAGNSEVFETLTNVTTGQYHLTFHKVTGEFIQSLPLIIE